MYTKGSSRQVWLKGAMSKPKDRRKSRPDGKVLAVTSTSILQPPGLKSGDARSPASRHTSAAGYNRDPSNWPWVMDCEGACQTKTEREIMMSSVMRVGEGSLGFQRGPTRSLKQKKFQKTFFDSLRCCTRCDKPSQR